MFFVLAVWTSVTQHLMSFSSQCLWFPSAIKTVKVVGHPAPEYTKWSRPQNSLWSFALRIYFSPVSITAAVRNKEFIHWDGGRAIVTDLWGFGDRKGQQAGARTRTRVIYLGWHFRDVILVSVWWGGCRWEWAEKIRSAVKYSVWKADKTLLYLVQHGTFLIGFGQNFDWFW